MISPDDFSLVKRYNLRFGEIAVKLGFITTHQLQEALEIQLSNEPSVRLRPHRLIGELLIEKGWMTYKQALAVLEELFESQKQQEHQ